MKKQWEQTQQRWSTQWALFREGPKKDVLFTFIPIQIKSLSSPSKPSASFVLVKSRKIQNPRNGHAPRSPPSTRHRRRSSLPHPPPPLHQTPTLALLPPLSSSAVGSPIHHAPLPLHAPKPVDIGARARQLQARCLWTYALTFSCIAGFIIIVLNSFQDQLVFYVTPSDALEKYATNPSKSKFRLGGLVQPAASPDMEFVITDLMTDILVRYRSSLPDLFREGHSVVVEGFVKPFTEEVRKEVSTKSVSEKARSGECYFSATEVLAKHDEKYMPGEVAAALEKNKKILAEEAKEAAGAESESNAVDGAAIKSS